VADAVGAMGDQLRQNDPIGLAQFADQAAEQIDRFSTYLRETDVDEMLADAQRFARRQPALFLGGAFAVGLLAARFLKSSTPSATSTGYRGTAGESRVPYADPRYTTRRAPSYTPPAVSRYGTMPSTSHRPSTPADARSTSPTGVAPGAGAPLVPQPPTFAPPPNEGAVAGSLPITPTAPTGGTPQAPRTSTGGGPPGSPTPGQP